MQSNNTAGNTVLEVYGEWLFDAATTLKMGYEEGRAIAVGTLCRIFCMPQSKRFSRENLQRFYQALRVGLKSDFLALYEVILNGYTLFEMELEGIGLNIPEFIFSLYRILPLCQANIADINFEALRFKTYRLISSFMLSIFQLDDLFTSTNVTILSSTIDVKLTPYIREIFEEPNLSNLSFIERAYTILINSLVYESSNVNCRYLLNLISIFCLNDSQYNQNARTIPFTTQVILDKAFEYKLDDNSQSLGCRSYCHRFGYSKYICCHLV
jgi:hypothetical protein